MSTYICWCWQVCDANEACGHGKPHNHNHGCPDACGVASRFVEANRVPNKCKPAGLREIAAYVQYRQRVEEE